MNMWRNSRRPPRGAPTGAPMGFELAPNCPEPPFRLQPIAIYTPANCQKLRALCAISGTAETGRAVSVVIDGSQEYIATADECRRWRLGEISVAPGFHSITARYAGGPSVPYSKIWVYIEAAEAASAT